MEQILKVAVVLFMAIPFIYMFYDVSRELLSKAYIGITKKAKPALVQTISSLFS